MGSKGNCVDEEARLKKNNQGTDIILLHMFDSPEKE